MNIPPAPTADKIADNEFVVDVLADPDNLGRVTFAAYWLDDATPSGVRGQVFTADLDEFTARNRRQREMSTRIR